MQHERSIKMSNYSVTSQAFRGGNKKNHEFDTIEDARRFATTHYKSSVIVWYEDGKQRLEFIKAE